MPYLNVKVSAPKSEELTQSIISILMKNTSELLEKKEEVTSISIDFIKPDMWFVNGVNLNKHKMNTFYLDVKVTKGTNTKVQKAQYIQKTFSDIKSVLGNLIPASYIIIDEVEADAWGFEGKTQEHRFINTTSL